MVDVFDGAGRLVRRLVPVGGALNAPWSMALAPTDFGAFSGALRVANVGDGTIAAFDAASGRPLGSLTRPDAMASLAASTCSEAEIRNPPRAARSAATLNRNKR